MDLSSTVILCELVILKELTDNTGHVAVERYKKKWYATRLAISSVATKLVYTVTFTEPRAWIGVYDITVEYPPVGLRGNVNLVKYDWTLSVSDGPQDNVDVWINSLALVPVIVNYLYIISILVANEGSWAKILTLRSFPADQLLDPL